MGIFKDVDGILKNTDTNDLFAPPQAPEGGYTIEFLYNKFHEMDLRYYVDLHALHHDVAFLNDQYQ
ncbi:hypothetical protein RYX36_030133, partial [Vicia faba]